MKKILARFTQIDPDDAGNAHNNSRGNLNAQYASFVGRHFQIGSLALVVDEIIAEGGFGMVFRVRSPLAGGPYCALKRTCVNNEQDLAVCKREVTIVSSLSHKNIIRYVASRVNQLPDQVSEVLLLTAYYPGSLSQLLNDRHQHQQRLTEVEVLRVISDLCEAVCRLHHCKTPIIHRDLKVENILIDERQNFVLCDLGSATSRVLYPAVHGLERCREEINRYTTLAYRAPELINLYHSVPLGPQMDIWALGCLLYFLCFTTLPFGESALAIQSGRYSLPDASPYSERLHKLIGYLLCVDAAKRPDVYQTCALVFSLNGRPNPAQNLHNLRVPHWQDLTTPLRESQLKSTNSHSSTPSLAHPGAPPPPTKAKNTSAIASQLSPIDAIASSNTSVVPRQRPRALAATTVAPPSSAATTATSMETSLALRPPPRPLTPTVGCQVGAVEAEPMTTSVETSNTVQEIVSHSNQTTFQSPLAIPTLPPAETQSAFHPVQPVANHVMPVWRGHHRTCSADVRFSYHTTEDDDGLMDGPASSSSSSHPVDAQQSSGVHTAPSLDLAFGNSRQTTPCNASGGWVPFSAQLRQAQSMASLPTQPLEEEEHSADSGGTPAVAGMQKCEWQFNEPRVMTKLAYG